MRYFASIALSICLILSLCACGETGDTGADLTPESQAAQGDTGSPRVDPAGSEDVESSDPVAGDPLPDAAPSETPAPSESPAV